MDGETALKRIAELRSGTPDERMRSPEADEQRALVLGSVEIRQRLAATEPALG
jgi:hypothetical protein